MNDQNLHSSSHEEETETPTKTQENPTSEGDSFASEEASVNSDVGSSSEDDSPTKKKRKKRSRSRVAPSDTSNVVKYRLTFLVGRSFKGTYYEKGATLDEVPEHVFNAYKGQKNTLRFEKM